jgi:hypothetical protein
MRGLLLALGLALSGCAAAPEVARRDVGLAEALPPMKTFAAKRPRPVLRANADIARDFLDLAFEMESGRQIERLSRFEGPVTVAIAPGAPGSVLPELTRLIARLRSEAGIDIALAAAGQPASITVQTVPRAELQRAVPQAACFVVPRVSSWADFLRSRRGEALNWTTLQTRTRTAVFLPGDVSPQEVRDCLHEEIAQALGPLNDLYRLSDSIFNDDNFHTVLTGFDMLVLRLYYAPEIRSGMTRAEVAAHLPGLLARMNPAGERRAAHPAQPVDRAWNDAIEVALGPRTPRTQRIAAAHRALSIARAQGWTDARLGFSLFVEGRLALGVDTERAVGAFSQALAVYRSLFGRDDIHAAHVAMQLAAFALSTGDAPTAIALVNDSLPAVIEAENAALLATLLMIKSQALLLEGRGAEAETVRLDSLGWARYGFGAAGAVQARMAEITALRPRAGAAVVARNRTGG